MRPQGQDPAPGDDDKEERPRNQPASEEPGKSRVNEQKIKENRDRLGVNEEHKTPEMEKGHRGTFP